MSKGEDTRERIIDRALEFASRDGLDGLSIGGLAADLRLSKSGLFAHFGSKEDLQIAVLEAAKTRFQDSVFRPAFRAPRGEPRLRKLFESWLRWLEDPCGDSGCLFVAAAVELDDREGRPHDVFLAMQRELMDTIARTVRIAMDEGHFRANLDADQFAFDLYGIVLAAHHFRRLFRDTATSKRARAAFERLLASARP